LGRLRRALEGDWRIAIAEPTRRVRGSVWERARIESGMGLVAMCYCTGASHGRTLDIRKARQGEGGLTRGWLLQAEMWSAAVAQSLCQHRQDHASGSGNGIASAGLNSTLVDKTSFPSISSTHLLGLANEISSHQIHQIERFIFSPTRQIWHSIVLITNHDRTLSGTPATSVRQRQDYASQNRFGLISTNGRADTCSSCTPA
jgi:hypothetical protein